MKKIILLAVILWPVSFFGQSVNGIFYSDTTLSNINEQSTAYFLKQYFADLHTDDIQLKLVFRQKTNMSQHFTFTILFKKIPLLHSTVKINTDNRGHIISIKKETFDLSMLKAYDPDAEMNQWNDSDAQNIANRYWKADRMLNTSEYKIFPVDTKPSVVLELNSWNETSDNTLVVDLKGNLLFNVDHTSHFKIDTMIHVNIFNPDPLTMANQVYGGVYKDNSDSNASWMNSLYANKMLAAMYDDSSHLFILENHLARIDDFESPVIPVATSLTSDFFFDRSESGFEDVSSLYHITTFHNYIASLGYDALMKLQLKVDAHAQFGVDNSAFNRNGGNPNLVMGIGGVDDAEDADVIVHEYAHGISWSANQNLNFSNERSGLDEGLADYFATSYSRSISSFNWANVFSWDGHNEFWGGRTATTTNNYPSMGDLYAIGEIWNCAMSNIWTDWGNAVADQLMLESLHFFTDSTTLPEAAMYILQSDTLLFGGIHAEKICKRFTDKHILDLCPSDTLLQSELQNSIGFAQDLRDAKLIFPEKRSGSYVLIDMMGRVVRKKDFNQLNELTISPLGLASGQYIFSIQTDQGNLRYKLMHY